jgi:plasmid stabilization system protein ParE
MKSGYRLSKPALEDIYDISGYIAQDNIDAAMRVEAAIFDACEKLARNPYLGERYTTANGKTVRIWVIPRFRNYSVIYRPETRPIRVLAVAHGRRNLDRILRTRTGK